MDKDEMLAAMRAASAAPKIDLWAAYMAGPAMAGAKCLPEDLWGPLGEALASHAGDFDRVRDISEEEGFRYHENHTRSDHHEVWQAQTFGELLRSATADGATLWYVPVDELVCLDAGADDVCDFVSISRLSFEGKEDCLRVAVHDLVLRLKSAVSDDEGDGVRVEG